MEYFKAGVASTFLPELARQLEDSFKPGTLDPPSTGVVIRVVPAGTDEHEKLRDGVNKAASGLNGDVSRSVKRSMRNTSCGEGNANRGLTLSRTMTTDRAAETYGE